MQNWLQVLSFEDEDIEFSKVVAQEQSKSFELAMREEMDTIAGALMTAVEEAFGPNFHYPRPGRTKLVAMMQKELNYIAETQVLSEDRDQHPDTGGLGR